jgi:hypothetical protein
LFGSGCCGSECCGSECWHPQGLRLLRLLLWLLRMLRLQSCCLAAQTRRDRAPKIAQDGAALLLRTAPKIARCHRRRSALARSAILSTCMHEERSGFDLAW